MARKPEPVTSDLPAALAGPDTSLVDLVDNLLGRGVVVDGEVVLGLAGVDLIYLRLAALLAAADRVAGGGSVPRTGTREGGQSPSSRAPAGQGGDEVRRGRPGARDAQGDEGDAAFDPLDLPDAGGASAVHVRPASMPDVHVRPASMPDAARGGETPDAPRWNPNPEEVRKGVMKLVLALAEFIRQLLERQAIRRMEAGTLSDEETERLGTALSQLEQTVREMAEQAGLDPEEVNLDLGPLGKLV